jgi:ribonuclease BN (tRNA processing enzyme)
VKLTVLGNTGPYPGPGGASSGYLFESQNTHIALDFGSGVLANLQQSLDFAKLDMIICSHLHSDHIADLFVLRYALQEKGLQLPLYVPFAPSLDLASLYYKEVFQLKKITDKLTLTQGHLNLTFKEMKHPFPDFATRITDGETTFLYTGDTCYTPELAEFATGVDVLLCDAAFLEDCETNKHLCVKEACEIATEAGVRTLILTHLAPFEEPDKYLQKGKKHFQGNLLVTEIGKTYDLKALADL